MLGRRSTNTNMEEHHHHRHHHHHNLNYRLEALVQCTDMDRLESITGGATTATTTATTTSAADFEGYSLNDMVRFGSGTLGSDMSDLIKTQIATHPLYPQLLFAYIECQKVGAPPEVATLLEEIGRENHRTTSTCAEIGADPELDEFMESYCEVLNRYKEELSRPFDEATVFLNNIESQLSSLCIDAPISTVCVSDNEAGGGSSEEELSCCEVEAPESQEYTVGMPPCDKNLKEVLLRKYSGYLSSLRKEFLKKRKNGKLPKDARMTLLDWWNGHYRWPYPTEEEKLKLSEVTGLDQKQINNWFINQRKRHWKPSEDMRFALMEGVSGGIEAATYFDGEGAGQDV